MENKRRMNNYLKVCAVSSFANRSTTYEVSKDNPVTKYMQKRVTQKLLIMSLIISTLISAENAVRAQALNTKGTDASENPARPARLSTGF